MSISPPTDIVLDVARAADPRRADAAARRLRNMAGDAGAPGFSSLLQSAGAANASVAAPPAAAVQAPAIGAYRSATRVPAQNAYQALGCLVLQKAVEDMMPDASSAAFGSGVAGSYWKSFLAEHMANALSTSVFRRLPGAAAQQSPADRPHAMTAPAAPLA